MISYELSSEDRKNILDLKQRVQLKPNSVSEFEIAISAINFVHNLSKHDGDSNFDKNDPLSIYDSVEKGQNMRCVEFSVLASAILWSFGIKNRIIGLKTEDVETREYGAGHVVIEFWSVDFSKWVMADVQHAITAYYAETPLSAYEIRQCLYEKNLKPDIKQLNGNDKRVNYLEWIKDYLYFIDTATKQDFSSHDRRNDRILMLVPNNYDRPEKFQNSFVMNVEYTENPQDFYSEPDTSY